MDRQPSPDGPASRGSSGMGLLLGSIPHVLILVLMVLGIVDTEGDDRGYAALFGLFEIYVVPIAFIVAFVLRSTRFHRMSFGIVVSTIIGAIIVTLATLIVGDANTWE
jgi:hypothetical protein